VGKKEKKMRRILMIGLPSTPTLNSLWPSADSNISVLLPSIYAKESRKEHSVGQGRQLPNTSFVVRKPDPLGKLLVTFK
jgi:hypothetical protein